MIGFAEALARRAEVLGLTVPESLFLPLETYFGLLARWNRTVNLTALAVDELAPAALDRLLLEPVAAAPHIPSACRDWTDFGSGGGSPAIPLKLLRPSMTLTMIEARSRKTAFLREAIRELRLDGARAETVRFEGILAAADRAQSADLVTARAVRLDSSFLSTADHVLRPGGSLVLFTAEPGGELQTNLSLAGSHPLLAGGRSWLSSYTRIA